MAKYRSIYYDGQRGWKLGKIVKGKVENNKLYVNDEGPITYTTIYASRNNDGLYENEFGDELFIPIE